MSQRHMTYRVVRLVSEDAGQAPTGIDAAECVAMVAALSIAAWVASGRKLPSYSRSQMPFRMTTLDQQDATHDE